MQQTNELDNHRDGGVEHYGTDGVQTYLWMTENTFTNVLCSKNSLMEFILSPSNLNRSYKQVVANQGSGGIDGMEVEGLLPYLLVHKEELLTSLYCGNYRPNPVRRVSIPKSNGKLRYLGIPTVIDRLIQQAVSQVLMPIFEPQFSNFSYGFRPGRSAHQALRQCREYIKQGYEYAVDMDLEKFFDTVNHSKLIEVLSRTVKDGRVVSLIHKYLNAGVMDGNIKERTYIGVPQGGPLSPLLSNILLNELDKEVDKRGHKYVRYADDLVVFCKSTRAGERILTNLTSFIEKKLFLKVNIAKTQVTPFYKLKFLSHGFYRRSSGVYFYAHYTAIEKLKSKLRELTSRNNGWGYARRKFCLAQYIRGWVNYFRMASLRMKLEKIDCWLRRRIRMCIWKSWKRVKTRSRQLRKLVPDEERAHQAANSRKSYWRMSAHPTVQEALSDERLREAGYLFFSDYYRTLKL